MFRENDDFKKYGKTTVNALICDNGLGDLLCSIMPLNHIVKDCPWINLLIWVPDYMVDFVKNVLPKNTIIRGFSEAEKKYDAKKPGITTRVNTQHSPMRIHPSKFAYHMLCDMDPSLEQMSYLKVNPINISKFNLPEKFVVMQGAFTEQVKTMPIKTFNSLVDYVITKGYTPVFLGREINETGKDGITYKANIVEGYDYSKGINLMNKTNLVESASIMDKSKLVICMDGGLSHLAGFTNSKIIAGYTFASDKQLMPTRDSIFGKDVHSVVPEESLNCKFCQTNITLLFNHDFRSCLYTEDKFTCQKQMTFEKFKQKIEENNLL